jgi:malate/lactate dehydrogenase
MWTGDAQMNDAADQRRFGVNAKRRVAIIGTGSVGASVAVSMLQSGVADELLLHDVRQAVAEGEAMDLAHGAKIAIQDFHSTAHDAGYAESESLERVI